MAVPCNGTPRDFTDNITLINGMMQRFAASGDAIDGLRWALPRVLGSLDAGRVAVSAPGR